MKKKPVSFTKLKDFALWEKAQEKRTLISFELELTSRCNLNCRHCYINLPPGDKEAATNELTVQEFSAIADQAVSLGALWCLITGGEPLLRKDFLDIYVMLKKKGLLVSVFTNATLITEEHIKIFKRYPPRDLEVTVYGATEKTYEKITRKKGSYRAFRKGLALLQKNGIKVRLKAMALRSNLKEMTTLAEFCRKNTSDYFRFDPLLHLRYDHDERRNKEIESERLTPEEIGELESSDAERFQMLKDKCHLFIVPEFSRSRSKKLFMCGAGMNSCSISPSGIFRLCSSLWHPDCIYDLKKGSLYEAWHKFVPEVREMESYRKEFLEGCRICSIANLCLWCPAHAYLESGELDAPVEYFCRTAHLRAKKLIEKNKLKI